MRVSVARDTLGTRDTYNTMLLGTTFSHRFARSLRLDPLKALEEIIALKMDILRLCCYWDEIEPTKDAFNFSQIQLLLDICEKNNQQVLLTVGMKAPRWPEFYIPAWAGKSPAEAGNHVLSYIEKVISTCKTYSCITYWQVENEPLDPSGPHNYKIVPDFLKKWRP
jgi:hypothetical protein